MTSRDFCYWLQGLFELGEPLQLDAKQTDLVKRHLAMVFLHEIDPSAGPPEKQADLTAIHEGQKTIVQSLEDLSKRPPAWWAPGTSEVKLRC
jgi:hypothetical protein